MSWNRSAFPLLAKLFGWLLLIGGVLGVPARAGHDRGPSYNYVLPHDTSVPSGQENWRWCSKCEVLYYGGHAGGACPAGGTHGGSPSYNYVLPHDTAVPNGQDNWRWCQRCEALFYGGHAGGRCARDRAAEPADPPKPGGSAHDRGPSSNYALWHDTPLPNGQDNWRWCTKCEALFYGGNAGGVCPKGGRHDRGPSYNYVLTHDAAVARGQDNWRWCRRCDGLFFGGHAGGSCPR